MIKRIYNLLITQPKVHREAYELNKQPVRWINFKNGYYDPVTGEMLEHNPDYLTINQIPFPYYPKDCEQVLQGGENIKKYLASSLPNKEEQQTFWEYFGYCMTQDTQFQKFLTLKGNGGTGKSVAVSLIQHVVGINNMSSISLQDLNKRFYATGMYGKLLNACADIPCKAMENTDVLKKAVGEDSLIYEKKGQEITPPVMRELERICLLKCVDRMWMDHIDNMDQLRQGIALRGYGQKDPVVEYRIEGFDMFDQMVDSIRESSVKMLLTIEIRRWKSPPAKALCPATVHPVPRGHPTASLCVSSKLAATTPAPAAAA